jgi:two-component system sensor histidine kinase KdpD
MFDEGRRRKERGQDVVIGAIQRDVTPDVAAIIPGIEIVPPVDGAIDLVALFRRHPEVCLIDELGNDNPPGSRNRQRWQDLQELLDRGISVITAVNLQHIREHQDAVERITGKRAPQSVPEDFLKEADEIEVVDAPPDILLRRTGNSQVPDARKLAELRELALLLAADVVDSQLQMYLDSHGVAARWGAQERILVCLTPHSNAAEMLRSAYRNALRFHGALLAAYVEQEGLRPNGREKLEQHLARARELGAEVHCLKGADFVETLLDFAREQRITQVFLGHTGRDQRFAFLRSPVDRLIDAAEDFDLRLFPHKGDE